MHPLVRRILGSQETGLVLVVVLRPIRQKSLSPKDAP